MKDKTVYATNAVLLILAAISFAILDYSLELGKFSGLVFYLYLLYFLAAQALVNLIIAITFKVKNKNFKPFFITFIAIVITTIIYLISAEIFN